MRERTALTALPGDRDVQIEQIGPKVRAYLRDRIEGRGFTEGSMAGVLDIIDKADAGLRVEAESVRDDLGAAWLADEVRAAILRNVHEPWIAQNDPLAAAWNRGLHRAHEIVDELAAALNRRQDDPR